MTRRIIIPAAGESSRISGIPKELLPIGEGETSLHRAVRLAQRLGEPVIITSPSKAHLHRRLFPDVEIQLQRSAPELFGAIRTGLRAGVPGGLIMADTVTDFDDLDFSETMLAGAIRFGTFETFEPWRFSAICGRSILTKSRDVPAPAKAWGVVGWNEVAADVLLGLDPTTHYDRAFEVVLRRLPSATFPLHFYHDLGTFEAYREFLINFPPHGAEG